MFDLQAPLSRGFVLSTPSLRPSTPASVAVQIPIVVFPKLAVV